MEISTNLINGYHTAYRKAFAELNNKDFEEVSLNADVIYDNANNVFRLKYLNNDYEVNCSTGEVSRLNSADEVSSNVKTIILHYLVNARSKPLSGKLVSFRELKKGASIYYLTFYKRAVEPLIKAFGEQPERLHLCASKLQGIRENYGEASTTIRILPMVPVTYIVWKGDEEAPASGTILFDDSIECFLPAEDIVFAASFGAYELIKLNK